jgi:hypothetical protein
MRDETEALFLIREILPNERKPEYPFVNILGILVGSEGGVGANIETLVVSRVT